MNARRGKTREILRKLTAYGSIDNPQVRISNLQSKAIGACRDSKLLLGKMRNKIFYILPGTLVNRVTIGCPYRRATSPARALSDCPFFMTGV